MDIQILLAFVAYNRTHSAEYIPGEGAYCPACVRFRLRPGRGRTMRTDGLVRYMVCPRCCQRFKAVEKQYDVGLVGIIPTTVAKRRKPRQNKVKKR